MVKNILIVLSGTGLAQLINIFATLILVKIISPSLFGTFLTWLAIVNILSVGLSLRMEIAQVNEISAEKRKILVTATLKFVLLCSIIGTLLLSVIIFFNFVNVGCEYILVFVAAFLTICFQISQNFFSLEGEFKSLNTIRIFNVLFFSIFQISFSYFWNNVWGLCIGYILGYILSLTIGAKEIYGFVLKNFKKVNIKAEIIQHKNYLKYSLPADLINALSANLPLILVASTFGSAAAGTLGLAFRFIAAPAALLSKAVLDIFKREASQSYYQHGTFKKVYIKTLLILIFLSILIGLCILVFSRYIIAYFLDPEWAKVTPILLILLPMFCIRFIASPLSFSVYITGKQNIDLIWQIFLVIITAITLQISNNFFNNLFYYSMGLSIIYLIYIYLSFRLASQKVLNQ